jgi:glutamine cyclotransferase
VYPSSDQLGRVSRIDVASGKVTARIRLPAPPVAAAATRDDVWLALERGDSIWRIDPRDDIAAAAVRVPGGAVDLAADEKSVWALGADGRISRIDPSSGEVVATVTLSRPAVAIAARDRRLFVAVR